MLLAYQELEDTVGVTGRYEGMTGNMRQVLNHLSNAGVLSPQVVSVVKELTDARNELVHVTQKSAEITAADALAYIDRGEDAMNTIAYEHGYSVGKRDRSNEEKGPPKRG